MRVRLSPRAPLLMSQDRETTLRESMLHVCKLLWERNLIGGSEGNVSCRLDANTVLVTPSGVMKGLIKSPHEFIKITSDGSPLIPSQIPTSEIDMHLCVYREREDVQSVVHAHPLCATGYAVAGKTVPHEITPEGALILGEVPLVPTAISGTPDMANKLIPFLKSHNVFLLQNHGALTISIDVYHAYMLMETLERTAQIAFNAEQLGGVKNLSKEYIEEFLASRAEKN